MLAGKPSFYQNLLKVVIAGYTLIWLTSCGSIVPVHYPRKKPFVYEYNINVEGNFNKDEKSKLESGLTNQLDDSIRVRTARKFFYRGIKWNRPVLDKPPVYDSANADKSVLSMRALLNARGYFKDTITFDTTLRIVRDDQYRTTVNFHVRPGKLVRLDSISYNIKNPDLQQLTETNMKESYLHKTGAFAKDTISFEFDRLVQLYRNNGYMRFSRDELVGVWDTLDVSLLQATPDLFEQVEILRLLRERREHPTANLEIRLRPGLDTTKLTKYYVGNITVHPDYNLDSSGYTPIETTVNGVKVIYFKKTFKPKILPQNIYLYHDSLYRISNYEKTINRFNSLGAWRPVNIEPRVRPGQDTVDFNIYLIPALKYSFSTNLEGSRNQSAISGNLFGIAVNLTLQNRNVFKAANQATTNIRYGIETGRDTLTNVKFVQTRQVSFSHTIIFPRAILPNSKIIPKKLRENFRTIFAFNAANTERRELYNLTTVNGSWGYETQWKNNLLSLKFPNIEYSLLKRRPLLDELFTKNPSLRNIFTDGFISSMIVGYSTTWGSKKQVNLFRSNLEGSGFLNLLHGKFIDSNLYRFVKVDAEFIHKIVHNKTSLIIRCFAGVGYELPYTASSKKKNNLPFFKEYFAGGPNSMRAWRLRQLGPGSVIKSFGSDGSPDRYGDVQFETNIEYRFPWFNVNGVKVNGALFTDIGNIWFLKKQAGVPEEVFSFNRFTKDIAVGVGTGLRIDFSFLVLRFDYSFKAKDPSPRPDNAVSQNKWFYNIKPLNGQLQIGISYPFIL